MFPPTGQELRLKTKQRALSVLLVDVSHAMEKVADEEMGHTMLHPPVPLLGLAAYLRQELGPERVQVEVLDLAVLPDGYAGITRATRRLRPDLVGIRSLSHTHRQLHRAATAAREAAPRALIVAGGAYANASPERAMEDPTLDAVCLAEGEYVLRDLARCLLQGADLARVKGITWRDQAGQLRQNPPMPQVQDLDELPWPDYSALDLSLYFGRHPATSVLRPYGVLMASRGCPFRCAFCHNLFGRTMRYRSPGDIAGEMARLHQRHEVRDFLICDNIFNADLGKAKEILRAVAELPLGPRLYFPQGLRGDRWDDEFLDLLAEAGTVELVYAVESASPRILQLMNKELDLERVVAGIHATAARGILVNAFFMIGYPGETEEELKATVQLIQELMEVIHFPFVHIVRAWDQGELLEQARAEGFDDDFLSRHAMQPHGFQDTVGQQLSFLPRALLREARLQVALMFRDHQRMARMVPAQRAAFTDEELVQKYATYFGASRASARALIAPYLKG